MSFSVAEVVSWTGGRVVNASAVGEGLDRIRVERPMPLGTSTPQGLAYFFAKEYHKELPGVRAGILITGEPFVKPLEAAQLPWWKSTAVVACADPYFAMAILSEKFAVKMSTVGHVTAPQSGSIHPSAVVSPRAELGADVQVGPHCVIEDGAKIGSGSVLYPGCYVGPGVEMGERCVLFAGVKLYEWTRLGHRVRIHAGSVLGSDGFGYAPKRQDGRVVAHGKIYHLGRVIVGNDVEIGALVTIDRGTFGDTTLADQVKLDNQVHVGHNSQLDEGAVVCGGTCLAGRTHLGKFSYVGGMTGIANGAYIGDGASVAALTLVTKDVPAGGTALGNPQRDYKEHFRAHAHLNRIALGKKKSSTERSEE